MRYACEERTKMNAGCLPRFNPPHLNGCISRCAPLLMQVIIYCRCIDVSTRRYITWSYDKANRRRQRKTNFLSTPDLYYREEGTRDVIGADAFWELCDFCLNRKWFRVIWDRRAQKHFATCVTNSISHQKFSPDTQLRRMLQKEDERLKVSRTWSNSTRLGLVIEYSTVLHVLISIQPEMIMKSMSIQRRNRRIDTVNSVWFPKIRLREKS